MFGVNFSYIFSILLLGLFGCIFFTTGFYLPKIRAWKSSKLYQQSKIYLDESIDNAGGLLEEGVRRGRIAHLLDSANQEILIHYFRLLYRTKPSQALLEWSKAPNNLKNIEIRTELFEKSLKTLKDDTLSLTDRRVAGEVCYTESQELLKNLIWAQNPDNRLGYCELLAETGKAELAQEEVSKLLEEYPLYPEGVFLLARLTVHLKDKSKLVEIGKALATLSSQRNKNGVEAIRHMTLLHLLNPLSYKSLVHCVELLKANPEAEPIDYLRIHALQYAVITNSDEREAIIAQCSKLFDLHNPKDLFIFCRWLARLYEFRAILEFLPASKARLEENLFKLRMNALAQNGKLEEIHTEVANAPMIPSIWRMIVEARAFAMAGKYDDSIKVLDRLIPILENDPREVRAVCLYLEASKDIRGLSHILEKLIKQPIHARFALSKLFEHRAGSVGLKKLILWVEQLALIKPNDPNLKTSLLYLQLLDPSLDAPSLALNDLIKEATSMSKNTQHPQARISLALAHLRNNSPDKSLVALGAPEDWRSWSKSRGAWSFIASQVFRLNNDSEKALVLKKDVEFTSMDRAEYESLKALFPDQF